MQVYLTLLHSYMQKWVPLCGTVCTSQSCPFWSHILVRMCTYISTHMHVHLTPYVCLAILAQLHKKHGCPSMALCVSVSLLFWSHTLVRMQTCISWPPMSASLSLHSYMANIGAHVWHYMCLSHFSSGPTPWLECVHASGHVCMFTWLSMSASPLWIVTCKHECPCVELCMSESPLFWSHTLVRIGTCMHVHLSPHVCLTPFAESHTNMGAP